MCVCARGWVPVRMRAHVRAGPATLLRAHVSPWPTLRLANSGAVCCLPLVASQSSIRDHVHTFCVTGLIRPAASVEADPVSLGDDLLSLTTAHQLQRALSTMPNMRAAGTYSVSACVGVRFVRVCVRVRVRVCMYLELSDDMLS